MPSKILGVRPTSPGFGTILIKPETCGLSWAKGSVPTPHGNVDVSWKVEGGKFTLDVTIPAGSTARIEIPGEGALVLGQGSGDSGPKLLATEKCNSLYLVGAGSYTFASTLPNP
jgi:hypothetical protein